jgi:hypothetical protein
LGVSFEQAIITPITDITVWVDGVLQVQNFGSTVGDYLVTDWGGSNVPGRQVVFFTPPAPGSRVLIALDVITSGVTAYEVVNDTLVFYTTINVGDVIEVISWNDTSQQDIITQVFVGPVVLGSFTVEGYDQTLYDQATVTNTPGSFNYTTGQPYSVNNFYLDGDVQDAGRLWVTLDGRRIYEGQDFTVSNGELVLATGPIQEQQVLIVTSFTDSVVPAAYAFRIFQDMRGVQAVYRITPETSTTLASNLSRDAISISVNDASVLTEPNLEENLLGVITIDGERIMYRERDLANNLLLGLRRGTAGTAVDSHAQSADVYLMSRDNLLPEQFQDFVLSYTTMGDGSTTVFYAPNINGNVFGDSSSVDAITIEVYVAGVRQLRLAQPGISQYRWILTDYDPVAVEFVVDNDPVSPSLAPPEGVEVTILQRRGYWWYDVATPETRELSLQETDTEPARFLTDR